MLDKSIIERFKNIVGEKNVETSSMSLHSYSYDATPGFRKTPDIVIAPHNTEEIAEIVKICNDHKIPLTPRGSGTNLSAGTTPLKGGVVLLFKLLNNILEIDDQNLTVTVQPGVVTKSLIEKVEAKGLLYPPDPSSMNISTIGGNINENSGGLRGLKYGVTRDYVLGLTIVLPNGDIIKTGGKLAKDVAGYDLTRLFVGSEGTLGIITEAILKLVPMPEYKKTMLATYEDIDDAAKTVSAIIENRIIPATLEFLDQPTVEVVEEYNQIGLPTDAKAILLIEQDGPESVVNKDIDKIAEICKELHAVTVSVAKNEQEATALTTARRSALSTIARLRPTTFLEDATVPRSQVAPMVKEINRIAEKYNVKICTFGHAGDGNLHPTVPTDVRDKEEYHRVEQAFAEIFEKAVELGGTITGEHGVGAMKAPFLKLKLGEEGVRALKNIKQSFDPNNIMNPGKMFFEDDEKGE
ncbi:glycolate oxidase subunit [Oceanobacillus iheyensis HTE831]|uniref:Glycolate oxidase subunit n=1 Tax=Oceanobacillus iheyensis (strain DSM 14371 / CIP 107618 / JCM 11309 / KCTC 3954 / HTE831) TaxID=221109 RepID=Q8EML1_OCEIH|nr:glycolate oxidase subunit GlcD [Oceanobacillus iheyensis]BAC14787.1 glycolate oxidase subunit [Oceanobacillus iheyensis HTE831]